MLKQPISESAAPHGPLEVVVHSVCPLQGGGKFLCRSVKSGSARDLFLQALPGLGLKQSLDATYKGRGGIKVFRQVIIFKYYY